MWHRLIHLLSTPYSIAILPALLVYLYLPWRQQPHEAVLVESEFRSVQTHNVYEDVDGDSIQEKIRLSMWDEQQTARIDILNRQNSFLASNIIPGQTLPQFNHPPAIFSIDGNDSNQILFLSEIRDSIFLNCYGISFPLKNIYIDFIPPGTESNAYAYDYIHFADVNGDGFQDVYLYISEGFRHKPRKIYAVDIMNQAILYQSAHIGSMPVSTLSGSADNELRIAVSTQSTGFFPEDTIHADNDKSAYLLIYDGHLEPVCLPRKLGGEFWRVDIFTRIIYDKTVIAAVINPNTPGAPDYAIHIYDFSGNLMHKYVPAADFAMANEGVFCSETDSSVLYYTDVEHQLHRFNLKDGSDRVVRLKELARPYFQAKTDIDGDGLAEFIFRDKSSGNYAIYDSELNRGALFTVPVDLLDLRTFRPIRDNAQYNLAMEGRNAELFLKYSRNQGYLLWNSLHFVLIYATFLFITLLLQYLNTRRLRHQIQLHNRMRELQFQNLRNQMDPHFTLNAINSVAQSILRDERNKAYDNFNKFAHLVRSLFRDANLSLRTLEQELEFTHNYLELQQGRFGDRLKTVVQVAPNIDLQCLIPPMSVQAYVENAIKHGLRDKTDGRLKIEISKTDHFLVILIEDNGVGREAARNNRSVYSTGMGNTLLNEYYQLLNTQQKAKISCEIVDLYHEQKAVGTRVVLQIPLTLKTLKNA